MLSSADVIQNFAVQYLFSINLRLEDRRENVRGRLGPVDKFGISTPFSGTG